MNTRAAGENDEDRNEIAHESLQLGLSLIQKIRNENSAYLIGTEGFSTFKVSHIALSEFPAEVMQDCHHNMYLSI
jgi:hypothetical protein